MNLDKCPYCGKKIIIGAKQCPFCGEDLSNIEPPEGYESKAQAGPSGSATNQNQGQAGPSNGQNTGQYGPSYGSNAGQYGTVPPPGPQQYSYQPNGPQYYARPNIQYRQLPMPSIMEAFKTCFLKKYANFHGRARRSEYWWFYLVYFAIGTLTSLLTFCFIDFKEYFNFTTQTTAYDIQESLDMLRRSILYNPGYWLSIIVGLAFLIPNLAAAVRRLHDIGRSGTMLLYFLLGLIPLLGALFIIVYGIIVLVWMCTDGHKEPNKWGPSPKYIPVNETNTGNNA